MLQLYLKTSNSKVSEIHREITKLHLFRSDAKIKGFFQPS